MREPCTVPDYSAGGWDGSGAGEVPVRLVQGLHEMHVAAPLVAAAAAAATDGWVFSGWTLIVRALINYRKKK